MPFDKNYLVNALKDGQYKLLVTMEENVESGGFGEHVESFVSEALPGQAVLKIAVPNRFIHQGKPDELYKEIGLDAESVADRIGEVLRQI